MNSSSGMDVNKNNETYMKSIEQLRTIARVNVYIDEKEMGDTNSILISSMKMNMLSGIYEKLYAFTLKSWRNLPQVPGSEPAYMIMWMIASEEYSLNHMTVDWKGASPSTFVYVWSMIERMRDMMESMNVDWTVSSRDCKGYCMVTGISEPADTRLYTREQTTPPQVMHMCTSMSTARVTNLDRDYVSFFDAETSMLMPGYGWRVI